MTPVDMSLKKPVYMPMTSTSPMSRELKVCSVPEAGSVVVVKSRLTYRHPRHHAPIAVEHVLEADIVPARGDVLVLS